MSQINDMTSTTIPEAVNIIKKLPVDLRSMLWGPPGLGKTKTIQNAFENETQIVDLRVQEVDEEGNLLVDEDGAPIWALDEDGDFITEQKEMKTIVVHVLAGQSEPTDIQGIPFNYKNLYAKYLIPWWAWLASDDDNVPTEFQGPMVLFFDDIVTAHEQTQAALYKLIDEGYLGQLKMRDNVRIIAAGNRVDDMSAVVDMPKALCNRLIHFYVHPHAEAWLDWATSNGIHPHVVYYIRKNNQRITTFSEVKDSTETHAWATPRTWEMLSKALFALEEAGLREQQIEEKATDTNVDLQDYEYITVQSCIGKLAIEFLTQIKKEFCAVPVEEIINNPHKAEVPPIKEIDRLFSTVTNLEYWFSQPENHKHYRAIAIYANRLHPEFSIMLTKSLVSVICGPNASEEIRLECVGTEEFDTLVDRWGSKINAKF